MADKKKSKPQDSIDVAAALTMWNEGKSLDHIGKHFGVSLWASRWAIKRAVKLGLGTARQGQAKRPEEQPPLWTLFYGTRL